MTTVRSFISTTAANIWTAPPYSNPGLRRFTRAHAIAAAGDAFIAVSLAGSLFFSVSPDASRRQVLTYLIVTMVPFAVMAPLIGPTIDRFRRGHRWVAVIIYCSRAALCIALAFSLYSAAFFVIALVLLVANKASGILKSALVPGLIDNPRHLVAANSRLARLTTIVGGTGGAIAAAITLRSGSMATLFVAALLFVMAAATAARLPRPHLGYDEPEGELEQEFEDEHRPLITVSATAYTVIRFAVGAFVFGLAFALRRASEPAWMYGVAIVAYGAGAYLGNVVAPIARRRFGEDRLISAALTGLTLAVVLAAAGGSRIMVISVSVVMGMATTFGRQGFDSLVQRYAPRALHARSFSRFETQFQLAWVLGGAFATAMVVSARISLALLIAILVPGSVLYLRSMAEARRFSGVGLLTPLLDPIEVYRSHLHASERWLDSGDLGLATVEVVASAQLGRVAGLEIDTATLDRIDRLGAAMMNGTIHTERVNRAEVADLIETLRLAGRANGS
jgi:MFS family permease